MHTTNDNRKRKEPESEEGEKKKQAHLVAMQLMFPKYIEGDISTSVSKLYMRGVTRYRGNLTPESYEIPKGSQTPFSYEENDYDDDSMTLMENILKCELDGIQRPHVTEKEELFDLLEVSRLHMRVEDMMLFLPEEFDVTEVALSVPLLGIRLRWLMERGTESQRSTFLAFLYGVFSRHLSCLAGGCVATEHRLLELSVFELCCRALYWFQETKGEKGRAKVMRSIRNDMAKAYDEYEFSIYRLLVDRMILSTNPHSTVDAYILLRRERPVYMRLWWNKMGPERKHNVIVMLTFLLGSFDFSYIIHPGLVEIADLYPLLIVNGMCYKRLACELTLPETTEEKQEEGSENPFGRNERLFHACYNFQQRHVFRIKGLLRIMIIQRKMKPVPTVAEFLKMTDMMLHFMYWGVPGVSDVPV